MGFNTRYKVFLDWTVPKNSEWNDDDNANWVEIVPDIEQFKKAPFNKEMFTRYSWGQVTFKNNPNLTGSAAETYNIIANASIDQEIRMKVTLPASLVDPDSSNVIRGYFGTNDCEFDQDSGIVIATPTILDQYTDLVENWETEVPIFGETIIRKSTWSIDPDMKGIDFSQSHNLPVELSISDMDEAQTPTDILLGNKTGGIFVNSKVEYDAAFSVYINAEILIADPTPPSWFILEVYDNDDNQIYSGALGSALSTGTLSESYNVDITIPKGDWVRVICSLNPTCTVNYNDIKIELSTTNIAYATTDVSVEIQESSLKTYEIWTEFKMGVTDSILKSNYDSTIPTLASYFNIDGSPKDTLLNSNLYAPYSTAASIDSSVIAELGINVIPISGLYMGTGNDIGAVLEPYGFELSEVEVYSDFWWGGWFNTVHKASTHALCKYSRFEKYVAQGDTPPVSGWTDTEYDNSNNERLWVKKPFDGTITEWNLGDIDDAGGTNASLEWDVRLKSNKVYPSSVESVVLQTRDFREIVQDVYNGTFLSLVNNDINSVFFWNDPDSDIPDVSANVNYAYQQGTENWLNKIAAAHTYQLKEINTDSEDSILKINFKDLMSDLKALFNNQIFWWVDILGVLHLEHLKYIDEAKVILDITKTATPNTPYLNNMELLTEISSWKFDKSEMYSLVNFQIANSGYKDFNDNNITYDKIVSNKRNEDIRNTLATKNITTDIRYCIENPSDIENGMILINHDSNYNAVISKVPISNTDFENGNLALSNILNRYKYEGIFLDAKINNIPVVFDVTTRTKVGKEIKLKGIYDYEYFKSKISIGRIESLIHDLDREHTKISLRYRFGSGSVSDTFILMVSEVGDFTGAEDVQFDFG